MNSDEQAVAALTPLGTADRSPFLAGNRMHLSQGFTLIELMIVVAVIAIIVAIALPTYQDYVARAQVTEGFSLAGDARAAIAVYHASHNSFPADNPAAGLADPSSITGEYVHSVTVGPSNGQIDVLFGNNASARISGKTLTLNTVTQDGSLAWSCSGMEPRYLPSACR